jgi:hypothetical protein
MTKQPEIPHDPTMDDLRMKVLDQDTFKPTEAGSMTDTIINVIRARHENFADHQQNDHAYKDFRACKDRATLLAILDEIDGIVNEPYHLGYQLPTIRAILERK